MSSTTHCLASNICIISCSSWSHMLHARALSSVAPHKNEPRVKTLYSRKPASLEIMWNRQTHSSNYANFFRWQFTGKKKKKNPRTQDILFYWPSHWRMFRLLAGIYFCSTDKSTVCISQRLLQSLLSFFYLYTKTTRIFFFFGIPH